MSQKVYLFNLLCNYFFVLSVWKSGDTWTTVCIWRSKGNFREVTPPSTMWVPRAELRPQGSASSPLPPEWSQPTLFDVFISRVALTKFFSFPETHSLLVIFELIPELLLDLGERNVQQSAKFKFQVENNLNINMGHTIFLRSIYSKINATYRSFNFIWESCVFSWSYKPSVVRTIVRLAFCNKFTDMRFLYLMHVFI